MCHRYTGVNGHSGSRAHKSFNISNGQLDQLYRNKLPMSQNVNGLSNTRCGVRGARCEVRGSAVAKVDSGEILVVVLFCFVSFRFVETCQRRRKGSASHD